MDFDSCFNAYVGIALRMSMLLIALPILSYLSKFLQIACSQRFSQHIGVLVGHFIFYGGLAFVTVNILHEFGFNVTALLGAAGVIGVAIGFASQTSVSNIISGFFLLLEHPFSIGDMIKSGDVVGIAESIDLLAVRVRTLDNKLVRIPNEIVLKHSLVNLTYYPVKRIDLLVSVTYASATDSIVFRINNTITKNKIFLTNPAPIILMNKIGQLDYDPQIRMFFSVRTWVAKEKFSSGASALIEQLKNEFDTDGIIITVAQVN